MSLRSWISLVTLVFLALIVFFAWDEIVKAWLLLERVNLWILALLIPLQIVSYVIGGEMMFSYLRQKGATKRISPLMQGRMALELNFVNHVLPSAGVSGLSYMTWLLSQFGISPARATAAQLVRFVMSFAAFATLLVVAVEVMVLDGAINRWIVLLSSGIVSAMIIGTLLLVYVLSSRERMAKCAQFISRIVNGTVRRVTRGRKRVILKDAIVSKFFDEMHHEYLTLRRERRILWQPYLWGIAFVVTEIAMFVVTFWALGVTVNPAPILIAYGLATFSGVLVVTPGGAGAYEAVMVWFLVTAGVGAGIAIAGILLTRVLLMIGTIVLGYVFYQRSLLKHGKPKSTV